MNFFGSSKKKQVQAKAASQTPVEAIGTIKGEIKIRSSCCSCSPGTGHLRFSRRSVLVVVRGCGRWSSKL